MPSQTTPIVYTDLHLPQLPFPSRFATVQGARMHYLQAGDPKGDPILLLHGNPTWSYLWRGVIPHLEHSGRVVAVDLIGHGRSDRPAIDYRFPTHRRYLDGFIDGLGLERLTLVVHDWGGGLGFDYAARHPDKIKAIAFMETAVPPIAAASLAALPDQLREFFTALRTDGLGEQLALDQNVFVEQLLPSPLGTATAISDQVLNGYRATHPRPQDRLAFLQWPREIPFDGHPADVAEAIDGYLAWIGQTHTPMLYVYGDPGAINDASTRRWAQTTITNLDTARIEGAAHFIPEDQPDAPGRVLADWLSRLPGSS
jgi:haloalkane dehalogenase